MQVERFTVPELLFNPSDVGMTQGGMAEAVCDAISSCDVGLHGSLYNNIVLTGGNMRFQGIQQRIYKDIRAMAPDHCQVEVHSPHDPGNYAWAGGSLMAQDPAVVQSQFVTKDAYQEWGVNAFLRVQW